LSAYNNYIDQVFQPVRPRLEMVVLKRDPWSWLEGRRGGTVLHRYGTRVSKWSLSRLRENRLRF